MAEMILGLQHMVTRQFNAHDPVVVSVGMVKAGEAINVIPDTAEFGASLRMYSAEARTKMRSAIPRLLEGIASAHGVEVDVDYQSETRSLSPTRPTRPLPPNRSPSSSVRNASPPGRPAGRV